MHLPCTHSPSPSRNRGERIRVGSQTQRGAGTGFAGSRYKRGSNLCPGHSPSASLCSVNRVGRSLERYRIKVYSDHGSWISWPLGFHVVLLGRYEPLPYGSPCRAASIRATTGVRLRREG
jgi:hypothetical protein